MTRHAYPMTNKRLQRAASIRSCLLTACLLTTVSALSFCTLQAKPIKANHALMTTQNAAIETPANLHTDGESHSQVLQTSIVKRNVVTPPYKIYAGDVLSFSVNEEPDFDQSNIIVRPDGYVTIRPLGQVYVNGQDIQELTKQLEASLTKYVNSPEVYLNVQEFHVPKLYLFGAMMRPGAYQPNRQTVMTNTPNNTNSAVATVGRRAKFENTNLSILNVLVNAGGVQHNADLSNIQVTKSDGEQHSVDLFSLLVKRDASQDLLLEEGDSVYVPELKSYPYGDEEFKLLTAAGIYPDQFPVRVLGDVEKPGLYYVGSDTPYLNTAIALASGFTLDAVKENIVIHRRTKGEDMARIVVNPRKFDFMLRPNDVVEIKDSRVAKVVRGAEHVSKISTPFVWGVTNMLR